MIGGDKKIDIQQHMDLLAGRYSDDTKRYRRNLILLSFTILGVSYLEATLSDLRVFGLSLGSQDNMKIQYLAAGLNIFWLLMFSLSRRIDDMLWNEKARQFQDIKNRLLLELQEAKEFADTLKPKQRANNANYQYYIELRNQADELDMVINSTKTTTNLQTTFEIIQMSLPYLLSLVSLFLLGKGIVG